MELDARFAFPLDEVCRLAGGVSLRTVYEEIADGKLTARKLRGRTVVLREDLAAWLAATPVSAVRAVEASSAPLGGVLPAGVGPRGGYTGRGP